MGPLRTVVIFRSEQFNMKETKEHFINPENYGDDLAIWLAGELEKQGAVIMRDEEFPGQEDFGWFIDCKINQNPYTLIIGHTLNDEEQFVWCMWIERNCGFMGSLFGGRKKNILPEAPELLHKVLKSSDKVTDLQWYTDDYLTKNFDELPQAEP